MQGTNGSGEGGGEPTALLHHPGNTLRLSVGGGEKRRADIINGKEKGNYEYIFAYFQV